MFKDKVAVSAFLVSLTGHCLFFGIRGSDHPLAVRNDELKDIPVTFEIAEPVLLPAIKVLGEEKKVKEAKAFSAPEPDPVPAHEIATEPEPASETTFKDEVLAPPLKEEYHEPLNASGTDNEEMLRYQDMVKQRIESARRYPLWARRQGIEGKVLLTFILLPDGTVQVVSVTGSSGYAVLDKESVSTVRRAEPFPPFPEKAGAKEMPMSVYLVFSLGEKKG